MSTVISGQTEKAFKAEMNLRHRVNMMLEWKMLQDMKGEVLYPIILCLADELIQNPRFQNAMILSMLLDKSSDVKFIYSEARKAFKLNPDESIFFFCGGKAVKFSTQGH